MKSITTLRNSICALLVVCLWSTSLLAQAPVTITTTVKDSLGVLLSGISVTCSVGGSETTQVTGPDGIAIFSTSSAGSYTLEALHPGYTFSPSSGQLSSGSSVTHEITGTVVPMTLSGTVKTASGTPVSTPTMTFNGSQTVVIDPQYGTFSIPVTYGDRYTLTIEDPAQEWFFTNPLTEGVVSGDTRFTYIAIPK